MRSRGLKPKAEGTKQTLARERADELAGALGAGRSEKAERFWVLGVGRWALALDAGRLDLEVWRSGGLDLGVHLEEKGPP